MKLTNRIIVFLDNIIRKSVDKILNKKNRQHGVGTGRVVEKNLKPEIIYNESGIMFVYHPYSSSHSLWRSQEYTLINEHRSKLISPVFDLGCGDGSFSKILFNSISYGVDPDNEALLNAKKLNLYHTLLNVPAENTGIDSNSIGSVFSNSVLEHTQNLENIIKEIFRILIPGGVFMFTVPNDQLVTQISTLFGKTESDRMNGPELFSHYNLLTNQEWIDLLQSNGFKIDLIQNYQHIDVIEKYRRSGFFLNRIYEKTFKSIPKGNQLIKLINLVKVSLNKKEGSCTFIIASKI
ncbi:MAG: class I SAM-dependent methyltransferase [Bacteroidetes bacterium]|nr:MAG: class I SAM-dependent methyltransferase [Bacteroidota bacterium]